jgi:hypothetical protein
MAENCMKLDWHDFVLLCDLLVDRAINIFHAARLVGRVARLTYSISMRPVVQRAGAIPSLAARTYNRARRDI